MSQGCFPFLTTYQFISTSYKFHEPLSLVKRLRLNDDETLEMQAAHQLSTMINIPYACRVSSTNFPELWLIFKQTNQLKSPKQLFCKYYLVFFIRQFCIKNLSLIRERFFYEIKFRYFLRIHKKYQSSLGSYQIATFFSKTFTSLDFQLFCSATSWLINKAEKFTQKGRNSANVKTLLQVVA